ncbi:MAG: bifunctional transaldolase/phosoglucose isomerase [Chloroflexi bacterium]|nr:bifunctional transaldolase/phosoglucose isomerase [Chloroflexota bacterium]
MTNLHQLHELGQSPWLNHMRRSFIQSGELRKWIGDGIEGVTANAATFEKAMIASADYDEAMRQEVAAGHPAKQIRDKLMAHDVQIAADYLHTIFTESDWLNGFASHELDPALTHNAAQTVAEVRHLAALSERGNIMIEVPATMAGLEAVRTLIGDGQSVNITHVFSIDVYERAAQAYIAGLEYLFEHHSMWRFTPTAVASFSVSAIDSAVDEALLEIGQPDLCGQTAIAMAKLLYDRFQQIFSGPRWEKLTRRGARVLRPKWTRTTPRNFAYPDTLYVDSLIGPDTVTTFSLATLNAFLDHGTAAPTLTENLEDARTHLARLAGLDIDLNAITTQLQRDYLIASEKQFQSVVQSISQKRDALENHWQRLETHLGSYQAGVNEALATLSKDEIMPRIWVHDHTVWKSEPDEIKNRLGWLHVTAVMQDNIHRLQTFTHAVREDGFTQALLIGMGGSSLAPELFHNTFGKPARPPYMPYPYLELSVLDTTDPEAIEALNRQLDLAKTLIIVATKSGSTVETLSGFNYFYNRMIDTVGEEAAGRHFVAITDPNSPLEAIAHHYRFRQVFINDKTIGGRYAALSYFGLVPAALVGTDLDTLLARAAAMASNTEPGHNTLIHDNLGATLGAVLGEMARNGRDKITFITSLALRSFGDWAEQLIAESTGKEGQGIVPVLAETVASPDSYGADRFFVHLRLQDDTMNDTAVQALIQAGHPVIILHLADLYDVGGQFFLWEMGTAVVGHLLQINPFNQPDVEAAKIRAREMVAAYKEKGELPLGEYEPPTEATLAAFLSQGRPGDYVAVQAYMAQTPATDKALQHLRTHLEQQTGLATTVGYGPRFLHSTGQLHKGDKGNGLFIQLVSEPLHDLPIPDTAGLNKTSLTFGALEKAQAIGDAHALQDARRRLILFNLGTEAVSGLRQLSV